jgi:hypothetical protein
VRLHDGSGCASGHTLGSCLVHAGERLAASTENSWVPSIKAVTRFWKVIPTAAFPSWSLLLTVVRLPARFIAVASKGAWGWVAGCAYPAAAVETPEDQRPREAVPCYTIV